MNRRVALKGIKLWKVMHNNGYVTDVGMQFIVLCAQPKFVDILVILVESRSIDANMEIVAGDTKTTPLYIASHNGHLPVAKALLQGGADVDKAADGGFTPLYTASEHGHVHVVLALLQSGADVDNAMDDGCTPLYIASEEGHVPVVQALLQGGADVDKATDDGTISLTVARQQGHTAIVRLLEGVTQRAPSAP